MAESQVPPTLSLLSEDSQPPRQAHDAGGPQVSLILFNGGD